MDEIAIVTIAALVGVGVLSLGLALIDLWVNG